MRNPAQPALPQALRPSARRRPLLTREHNAGTASPPSLILWPRCAYLATVADPGTGLVFNPNGVSTGSGPRARTVYIETKNIAGGLSAGIPFHLAVICPSAANAKIAVVAASGLPARGSPLTSSFPASAGQYTLATSQPLPACGDRHAWLGQHQLPFDPATVEITPGPAPNTAGVQVRQLGFFGGNLVSESFHAAMICQPATAALLTPRPTVAGGANPYTRPNWHSSPP